MDPDFPDPVAVEKNVDFSAAPHRRASALEYMALPHPGAQSPPQLHQRDAGDERRQTLQEIKDHLFLLKEFEDIVDDEEILQRKRDLFAALPPPPPVSKRSRYAS